MEAQFQDLPPLKRLRLKQLDLERAQQLSQPEVKSLQLPAKKRKQNRVNYDDENGENSNPTYRCLPAKKRIWAIDPDLLSGNVLSPFDLNIEYKPSVEEKPVKKNPTVMVESNLEGEFDDKENIDPLGKGKDLDLSVAELKDKELEKEEVEEDDDGTMCAVCQSTDGDPSNPIVFCDGCDLMVHASCYGNPLVKAIPEGDWFCKQCIASSSSKNQEKLFSCCLCTSKGGAMKPTKDGKWAHITCSLFVPEVYFEDSNGREGICCNEIPSKRWKDRCYLCKIRRGCVIECSEMKCKSTFHVTCGLKEDLCIEYREGKKTGGGIVVGFCNEHTKLWEKVQGSRKFKIVAREP